jgi:hypothetical protein
MLQDCRAWVWKRVKKFSAGGRILLDFFGKVVLYVYNIRQGMSSGLRAGRLFDK